MNRKNLLKIISGFLFAPLINIHEALSQESKRIGSNVDFYNEICNVLNNQVMFNLNDHTSRDKAKQCVKIICNRYLKAKVFYDYIVICDSTNNTPAIIDNNDFRLLVNYKTNKNIHNFAVNFKVDKETYRFFYEEVYFGDKIV